MSLYNSLNDLTQKKPANIFVRFHACRDKIWFVEVTVRALKSKFWRVKAHERVINAPTISDDKCFRIRIQLPNKM